MPAKNSRRAEPPPPKPPYAGTRLRSFRIADDLYARARAVAKGRGESLTGVVIRALERYVKRYE